MKNVTLWIVIGAIALFALGLFGGMFMPFGWNNSAFGYGCANGYGMMGYRGFMPMMGGWGMVPFGFLGMLFMWLIPLGVLALIVGGIFWIVRALTQKQVSPS
jgi:hypothetical protein